MKNLLVVASLILVGMVPAISEAHIERIWQERYCEGMELGKHLPSGGYVDCLSAEYAIEVDWASKWAEAVGQSLYYADATGRKPEIILLCEESEGPIEGLCRSYVYRLEYALRFVNAHVYVWTCAIDRDLKLEDCFRPEIQPTDTTSAEPRNFRCQHQTLPEFTLREKSNPTDEQVEQLCQCVWDKLGTWEKNGGHFSVQR